MPSPCEGACFTDRKAQRGSGPWWPWESHSPPPGLSPSQGQVGGRGQGREGVPGLLGHLGLLHAGQCVLGSLGGLIHVVLHFAQKGGIVCLGRFCEESGDEWGGLASGEPLAPARPLIRARHPQATCQGSSRQIAAHAPPPARSHQLLTGRGQERQEGSNEEDPGLHGTFVPAGKCPVRGAPRPPTAAGPSLGRRSGP